MQNTSENQGLLASQASRIFSGTTLCHIELPGVIRRKNESHARATPEKQDSFPQKKILRETNGVKPESSKSDGNRGVLGQIN